VAHKVITAACPFVSRHTTLSLSFSRAARPRLRAVCLWWRRPRRRRRPTPGAESFAGDEHPPGTPTPSLPFLLCETKHPNPGSAPAHSVPPPEAFPFPSLFLLSGIGRLAPPARPSTAVPDSPYSSAGRCLCSCVAAAPELRRVPGLLAANATAQCVCASACRRPTAVVALPLLLAFFTRLHL
jgi:hypothetical protein